MIRKKEVARTQINILPRILFYLTTKIEKESQVEKTTVTYGIYSGIIRQQRLFSPSIGVEEVRITLAAIIFRAVTAVTATERASIETRHCTRTDCTAEASPVIDLCCAGTHWGKDWPPNWSTGDCCN
jgi:hypothetical protein